MNEPIAPAAEEAPSAIDALPSVDTNNGPSGSEAFADQIGSRMDDILNGKDFDATPEAPSEVTPEAGATEAETLEAEALEAEALEAETAKEPSFDPTEDLNVDTDNWTPEAARSFVKTKERLKETRAQYEQEVAARKQLETKVKELEGSIDPEQMTTLQKQLDEYKQKEVLSDLENSALFAEQVRDPINKILDSAVALGEKVGVDENDLYKVFGAADEDAQEELISELFIDASDRDRAQLYRLLEDMKPLVERRTQLFEHAEEASKEAQLLEEQRAKFQAAERAKLRQNVARNVVERITQKLPFLSDLEGVDPEQLQKAAAEPDPRDIHEVDFAYFVASGKLLPAVAKQVAMLTKERDTLIKQLSEYEQASPAAGGGNGGSGSSRSTADEGLSVADAINRRMSGLG